MKYDHKIDDELTEDNENDLFSLCCNIMKHEEIVRIKDRYFQIFFGPEHDSWIELSPVILELSVDEAQHIMHCLQRTNARNSFGKLEGILDTCEKVEEEIYEQLKKILKIPD